MFTVGMFKGKSKDWFFVFGEAWTGAGSMVDVEGFALSNMHFLYRFRGRRQH